MTYLNSRDLSTGTPGGEQPLAQVPYTMNPIHELVAGSRMGAKTCPEVSFNSSMILCDSLSPDTHLRRPSHPIKDNQPPSSKFLLHFWLWNEGASRRRNSENNCFTPTSVRCVGHFARKINVVCLPKLKTWITGEKSKVSFFPDFLEWSKVP